MLATTVITHLSNSFGWIPPKPPSDIPEWWINSPGVNPIYRSGIQWEQTPYLAREAGEDHIYKVTGTNMYGNNNIKAQQIQLFKNSNYYDIPLVNINGEETTYFIRFTWEDHEDIASTNWDPHVYLYLYNGNTPIKGYYNHYWEGPIDTSEIQHVYLYAGADTYSKTYSNVTSVYNNVLYAAVCCIKTNEVADHFGVAIELDWIEQTYGVHLPSKWLGSAN